MNKYDLLQSNCTSWKEIATSRGTECEALRKALETIRQMANLRYQYKALDVFNVARVALEKVQQ